MVLIFSGLQTIFISFRGVNGAPKVPSPGEFRRHENALVGSGTGATILYSHVCITVDNPALREISEKAPEPKFGGHARVLNGITETQASNNQSSRLHFQAKIHHLSESVLP